MYKQTNTKTVLLTKSLAKTFSDLPSFVGDRDRNSTAGQERIRWLAAELRDGKFYSPKWATAELNGTTYRINGGHSSLMLAECNGDFPKGLKAVIEEFVVEDESDIAELFSKFDNRKSIRTKREKAQANSRIHRSLDEVSPSAVLKAMEGVAIAMGYADKDFGKLDEDAKIRLIHTHEDFAIFANQFIGYCHLVRHGVVAAIFATYKANAEAAQEFWELVRDETHTDVNHPSRVLASFLRTYSKQTRGLKAWDTRAFYSKCIHAWNAFRTNQTTMLKYHASSPTPSAV